ncbi:MAG: amidohydrolase [Eubacteriales bacterium]
MNKAKREILFEADSRLEDIWGLAKQIGENPEEGYKEYFAVQVLTNYLRENDFEVIKPLADMDTAFQAVYKSGMPGPKIVFLAEYDALPDIGHGCGHNLIGAASVGAAVVLGKMLELPGEVQVVGSPAEETSGAKVILAEKGLFNDSDAAMMFHPGSCNVPELSSLALDAVEIIFHGKKAHMAVSDKVGINALEAMINFFQRTSKMKKWLAKDERIDGVIIEGGQSPNIVPDKAIAHFYIRARTREALDRVRIKVIKAAEKSALEVMAKMDWNYYEYSYNEMCSNKELAACFRNNLSDLGEKNIEAPQLMAGSVDMGNVSHVVPAIHAYLQMGKGTEIPHTLEFAQAALSQEGKKVLCMAIKSLALTGWDVLTDIQLLNKLKKEFKKNE